MNNAVWEGDPDHLPLRTLVGDAESVPASTTVESLQAVFAQKGVDFLAVVDGKRLLGLCSRRQLTQQLSSRFGFALLARHPVSAFLMAAPMTVSEETPITAVFKAAASREAQEFYDDVLLVDCEKCFVGMIPMRTLVRLQTEFLIRNNARLEASREELAAKNRTMEEDLLMAREMQLAMQPQAHAPLSANGLTLSIAHRYQPAAGVSGDFFDVLRISNHGAGILVCDVMGHGVRSALITAMVRAMIEELRPVAADPGAFLTHLNRDLTRILRHAGGLIFVTASYAVIHMDVGRLDYAQAGHPTPFRWDAQTRLVRPVACPPESAGPALGLMDDFEFETVTASFASGDRLALFTDGLFEAANPAGEEFGLQRLGQVLAGVADRPLGEALDTVLREVTHFSDGAFADDVCIIATEVNPD
jgi:serine phosphatase RsbU (regulator of sigma subunit)/CBS domain-containing protein